MGPCLETISRAMKAKCIVVDGDMKDEHVDISCVGTLSLILLYAKANEIGCHITWICSNYWWDYIQVLFVAATVKKDNLLLEWTQSRHKRDSEIWSFELRSACGVAYLGAIKRVAALIFGSLGRRCKFDLNRVKDLDIASRFSWSWAI